MDELTQKLSIIYEELQTLDIKPTKRNVAILGKAYSTLEEIYRHLATSKETVQQNSESIN